MRDKIFTLKQEIHTLLDNFHEETGMIPEVEIETKEVTTKEKQTVLASAITIWLK